MTRPTRPCVPPFPPRAGCAVFVLVTDSSEVLDCAVLAGAGPIAPNDQAKTGEGAFG